MRAKRLAHAVNLTAKSSVLLIPPYGDMHTVRLASLWNLCPLVLARSKLKGEAGQKGDGASEEIWRAAYIQEAMVVFFMSFQQGLEISLVIMAVIWNQI